MSGLGIGLAALGCLLIAVVALWLLASQPAVDAAKKGKKSHIRWLTNWRMYLGCAGIMPAILLSLLVIGYLIWSLLQPF